MRRILLGSAGLLVTALALALPAAHASALGQLPDVAVPLLALPAVPLVVTLALERPPPWLVVWAFPTSHLPALVAAPALVGPDVYAGTPGVLALLVVAAATATWIAVGLVPDTPARGPTSAVATEPPPPVSPPATKPTARVLPWLTAALAVGTWVAFAMPALGGRDAGPHPDALSASVALLAGSVAAWLVTTGHLLGGLGELLLEPNRRSHARLWLRVMPRAGRRRWVASLVQAVLSLGLLALWYGLGLGR